MQVVLGVDFFSRHKSRMFAGNKVVLYRTLVRANEWNRHSRILTNSL